MALSLQFTDGMPVDLAQRLAAANVYAPPRPPPHH
jgi:hypothetical protein